MVIPFNSIVELVLLPFVDIRKICFLKLFITYIHTFMYVAFRMEWGPRICNCPGLHLTSPRSCICIMYVTVFLEGKE
jgi:hypothetical protein